MKFLKDLWPYVVVAAAIAFFTAPRKQPRVAASLAEEILAENDLLGKAGA